MTVEEKLEYDRKKEELRKRNKEEYQRVRAALQILCKDPNAQIVLRHIATKLSGFFKSSIVLNPQTNEISMNSMAYNEGRRSVYLDLRRMLTDDARRIIESKGEESHGE